MTMTMFAPVHLWDEGSYWLHLTGEFFQSLIFILYYFIYLFLLILLIFFESLVLE